MTGPMKVSQVGGPLGSGTYWVDLRTRGGRKRVASVEALSSVTWERVADDTSSATVVLPVRKLSSRCRTALEDAYAWVHEVRIFRDDEPVWEGPLFQPQWATDSVTLPCRDVSAWLDRRVVHNSYNHTGISYDLSRHAEEMIRDALAPDDPGALEHLVSYPSGVLGTWAVMANTAQAGGELRNFAEAGLDWTVVGRRIILFGPATTLGRTRQLNEQHFTSDALTVTQDGSLACTRALVVSQDLEQDDETGEIVAGSTPTLVVRGEYGSAAPDPALGLHEIVITDDSQVPPGVEAATLTAQARVRGANPIPLYVGVSSGATLAACAPVGVRELIPGMMVPVSTQNTARKVLNTMQLVSVQGSWSASSGSGVAEQITVNLATPGGGS